MRSTALALGIAAYVTLVTCAPLRAAEPPPGADGGPPTIEEMLAVVEGAPADDVAAPAGRGPAAVLRPPGAARAPQTPPDVQAEIKAVKSRANRVGSYYQKQRNLYRLARLNSDFDNQKQALLLVTEMMRKKFFRASRSPVPRAYALGDRYDLYYFDAYGENAGCQEMMYARALIVLGAKKEAAKAIADAKVKQQRRPASLLAMHQSELARTGEFVQSYPAAGARLVEIEAALAAAPTAALQWELVNLCSPPENRAVKPLKWLEALLVMIGQYPDHEGVTTGLAHWQLMHAYRTFAMHEKSVEVLDKLAEWPQKIRIRAAPWNVRQADILWERANSWAKLGVLQEELKDRSALASYRKSLEDFEAFKEHYPKDSRLVPGLRSGVSVQQRRVADLRAAVARLAR